MKLASLKVGGRDGTLVVVDRSLIRAVLVPELACTLQQAIEDWDRVEPTLAATCQTHGWSQRSKLYGAQTGCARASDRAHEVQRGKAP